MLKDLEQLLSGFDLEIDGLRAATRALSSDKSGQEAAIPEKIGQERPPELNSEALGLNSDGLLGDTSGPFEVLASVLEDHGLKLEKLIAVQKATLTALKAPKKLIFDDDGRPIGAEIDRGNA